MAFLPEEDRREREVRQHRRQLRLIQVREQERVLAAQKREELKVRAQQQKQERRLAEEGVQEAAAHAIQEQYEDYMAGMGQAHELAAALSASQRISSQEELATSANARAKAVERGDAAALRVREARQAQLRLKEQRIAKLLKAREEEQELARSLAASTRANNPKPTTSPSSSTIESQFYASTYFHRAPVRKVEERRPALAAAEAMLNESTAASLSFHPRGSWRARDALDLISVPTPAAVPLPALVPVPAPAPASAPTHHQSLPWPSSPATPEPALPATPRETDRDETVFPEHVAVEAEGTTHSPVESAGRVPTPAAGSSPWLPNENVLIGATPTPEPMNGERADSHHSLSTSNIDPPPAPSLTSHIIPTPGLRLPYTRARLGALVAAQRQQLARVPVLPTQSIASDTVPISSDLWRSLLFASTAPTSEHPHLYATAINDQQHLLSHGAQSLVHTDHVHRHTQQHPESSIFPPHLTESHQPPLSPDIDDQLSAHSLDSLLPAPASPWW
eukprot:m.5964 g.5964  ORF g.5964 m.5964 type:complete len:507 (-) comp4664_c0_seq2:58-1578(-)